MPRPDLAVPQQVRIGILPPDAPRTARLARRWLTRGTARGRPVGSITPFAVLAALVVLGLLLRTGVPVSCAVAVALLAPVCVRFVPLRLDAAARRRVRVLDVDYDIAALEQVIVRHQQVISAHAQAPVPELRQAVRLSHRLLWDCATLLQACSGPVTGARVRAYERPHAMLVDQALDAAAAHAEKEFVVSLPPLPYTPVPHSPDPVPDHDLLAPEAVAEAARELNDLASAARYATSLLRPPALRPRSDVDEVEGRTAVCPEWRRS